MSLTDSQLSVLKQHDSTYNRAFLKHNLLPIGPYTRDKFPLLKIEKKHKEFFVRVDCCMVSRYFINENKERWFDTLFYPTDSWIKEYEEKEKKFTDKKKSENTEGEREKSLDEKLYEKLKNDGLGSLCLNLNTPRKTNGKIQLKRKEKPKRLQLKKKPKRIQLKKKPSKKVQLKKRK